MRNSGRPSARFLGLLHGQAVIRGDEWAATVVEAKAIEQGVWQRARRHSSEFVVRQHALHWAANEDDSLPSNTPPIAGTAWTVQIAV